MITEKQNSAEKIAGAISRVGGLPVLLLLVICFIALFDSVIVLAGGWSEMDLVGIALSFCLVMVIEALLLSLAPGQPGRVGIGNDFNLLRTAAFGGVVVIVVSLEQAFWIPRFHLDELKRDALSSGAAKSYLPVVNANLSKTHMVSNNLSQLSETAAHYASLESGNEGTNSRPTCNSEHLGPGARYDYRVSDSHKLRQLSDDFDYSRDRYAKSAAVLRELLAGSAVERNALVKATSEIEATARVVGASVEQARIWVEQRRKEADTGVFRRSRQGNEVFVQCQFPELGGIAQTLSGFHLVSLPSVRMPDVGEGVRTSLIGAFESTIRFFTLRWGTLSAPEIVSIVLGSLTTLSLVWFRREAHRRGVTGSKIELDFSLAAVPGVVNELFAQSLRNRTHYVAYLKAGDELTPLGQMLDDLRHKGYAEYKGRMGRLALWKVPKMVRQSLEGVDYVHKYALSPEVVTILRRNYERGDLSAGSEREDAPVEARPVRAVYSRQSGISGQQVVNEQVNK
ncbi:MAG: hypothetical protein ABW148_17745 [Sedimenticola sp.]